jgi:cell division protein FtsB
MNLDTILLILGSFISLLLIVNAYFTRETLLRVVKLEVKLENNATRQYYLEKQADENSHEVKKLRERMHKFEATCEQVYNYVIDTEKK